MKTFKIIQNMKSKILVLIITISLFACGKNENKQSELLKLKAKRDKIDEQIAILEKEISESNTGNEKKKYFLVSTETLKFKPFNNYIEVYGKLDGDENVAVYPKMSGTVIKKYVDVGQKVRKDQILAQLDDAVYQEQLNDLRTSLALAKDMFEKQKTLWEQKIGSEVQYLQAKTNKESLEKKESLLLEQIDMMKIKSPIDGTVEEINLKVGQIATALSTSPVFRIVNFNNLKIVADISEGYANAIKKGDKAKISFPDVNKEFNSEVSFVSKFINTVNRTFQIELNFKSDPDNLKANMIALVVINNYSNNRAISLPVNIIQNDDKGDYVFIAVKENNENVARKRYIKKGYIYNGIVEITSGLNEGDNVVTTGLINIEDGSYLQIAE